MNIAIMQRKAIKNVTTVISAKARLCDQVGLSVCLSGCPSVCEQDYCNSNQLISLKLGVLIGPNNWKNWLTSGGDPVLDTDSG